MEIGEVLGKWHYLRIIEHFSKSEPSKFSSLYFTTKTIGEKFKIPEVNKDNFSFGVADFIGVMINFFCWLDSLCGFRVISAALRSFRFGHRDLPVFLVIFALHLGLLGVWKNRRENQWDSLTKAREGKRSEELCCKGKTLGEAWTGGSALFKARVRKLFLSNFSRSYFSKKKLLKLYVFWRSFGVKIWFWRNKNSCGHDL